MVALLLLFQVIEVLAASQHSPPIVDGGTRKAHDNVFRPANSSVLDAAALERFVVNRTHGPPPGGGGWFNLSVLAGRYSVAGPDQPGGYGRCAAHLCFGFLAPLRRVSLSMTAVTVVLGQRDRTAVVAQDAHSFNLLGLITVYQTTPSNQAVVVDIGRGNPANKSLTVRVEKGYPSTDWTSPGKPFPCGVFVPEYQRWRPGTGMLTYTAIDRTRGSRDRLFTLFFDAGTLPSIGFEQIEVGDLLGCRPRDTDYTFVVRNCSGCTFDSISLYGGPGFGFFEDGGGSSSNKFLRCRILPPPTPAGAVHAPVLSTAADGLHSSHASFGPIVENCIFERMGDDGIAIHGSYLLVVSSPNSTSVIVASGSRHTPNVQVGDRLWLYDPQLRPAAELEVASWAPMASSYLPPGNPASRSLPKRYHQTGPYLSVRLAGHLDNRVGFDWLISNTARTGASFALRNNTVRDNHARAVNLKASDGVVAGNIFSDNFHGGIIVAPELYWGESDYSRNLQIESNVVTNAGSAKWSYGALTISCELLLIFATYIRTNQHLIFEIHFSHAPMIFVQGQSEWAQPFHMGRRGMVEAQLSPREAVTELSRSSATVLLTATRGASGYHPPPVYSSRTTRSCGHGNTAHGRRTPHRTLCPQTRWCLSRNRPVSLCKGTACLMLDPLPRRSPM
jgi:multisubunit Na+/H+ antiporter MnhF subunit